MEGQVSPGPAPLPTLRRTVTSGLVGGGVALLCLLPPGLHNITGPLGPLIGGFVAGGRARADSQAALIIGPIVGVMVGLFANLFGAVILMFLPVGKAGVGALELVAVAILLYGSVLAAVGALIGGRRSRRKAEQAPEVDLDYRPL